MDTPIKKVYILGGPDVNTRINLAEFLMENNFSVELLGTMPLIESGVIPYTRYKIPNTLISIQWIGTLNKLRNLVDNDSIILSFDTKQNVIAPLLNKFKPKVKVIRTINGMGRIYNLTNSSIIQKRLYELIFRLTDKYCLNNVFQNSDNMSYFLGRNITNRNKAFLIRGSGVELPRHTVSKQKKDDSIIILYASRLLKSKGIEEFYKAAEYFANINKSKKISFYVAGTGSEYEVLRAKLHPDIKYLGQLSSVLKVLDLSDIVVLQSGYSEGIPRILIEGAVYGNALITCDRPGCNDIVINGYNGFYVQFGSAIDLIKALNDLISNNEMLEKFKMNSVSHSRLFSQDIVFNNYLDLLKGI